MVSLHSVYLHIPFCRTKCTYCAFNTYTKLEALIEPFVDALVNEIHCVGRSAPGLPVHTIFFGGGTPSMLAAAHFRRILDTLRQYYPLTADAEISIEANPNDISFDYLAQVRETGINRLSLGMQSANANELRLFARRHDNDDLAGAVMAARKAGFDSLNLDLIYSIPHQTLADWEWTLQQALALKPDHISLYALGLEDDTPLKEWVDSGRLPTPDDDLAADMYEAATSELALHGLEQYEISNWAAPGHQCRHNLQYWRNLPYLGLGPGAHGFANGIRYSVELSPQRYIRLLSNVDENCSFPLSPAVAEHTVLERKDEIAETLIMGLRLTQEGIQRDAFQQRFGDDITTIFPEVIAKYQKHGLLDVDKTCMRLTKEARLVSNMILREFV